MKKIFIFVIPVTLFCLAGSISAAKYSTAVSLFANDNSLPREVFRYYIDFNREINIASLKMTPVSGKYKNAGIPLYTVPVAKYRAFIYFIPHKEMKEDSELFYKLTFESGKWNGKAFGSDALRKSISPNLVPNYSFEKVRKARERFLTWEGRSVVIDWRLQDFSREYLQVKNPGSSCRTAKDEAIDGIRSLCFKSGKPQAAGNRNILITPSAYSLRPIPLEPDTAYRLSFFAKITKRFDNGMNFQGIGASLVFLNAEKKNIPNGLFSVLYPITYKLEEEYLNKWVYVENSDVTTSDTRFGRINIAEKISGCLYIDLLELRKLNSKAQPQIVVGDIVEIKK